MPSGRVLLVDDQVGQLEILELYLKGLPLDIRLDRPEIALFVNRNAGAFSFFAIGWRPLRTS